MIRTAQIHVPLALYLNLSLTPLKMDIREGGFQATSSVQGDHSSQSHLFFINYYLFLGILGMRLTLTCKGFRSFNLNDFNNTVNILNSSVSSKMVKMAVSVCVFPSHS